MNLVAAVDPLSFQHWSVGIQTAEALARTIFDEVAEVPELVACSC